MSTVSQWLADNKLTLNLAKTKSMLFGTLQRLSKCDSLKLLVNDVDIEHVETFKYLGLWLDSALTWRSHVQKLCVKISQRTGVIARLRKILNERTLVTIYNSIILPQFDNCDVIWSSCGKNLQEKLQVLQNRAARVILSAGRRDHAPDLFRRLKWQSLETRRQMHIRKFVHKCLHGKVPKYLTGKYVASRDCHNYSSRSATAGSLVIPKPRLESGKRTLLFRGAQLYNAMPYNLKQCTVDSFNKNYKKLFN